MALVTNYQASFTAGELAPSLHARVDLAKYRTGAKKIENWFVHAHGGISRRDGLQYIGTAGNETNRVRLFSFEASTNDTYILEFGDQYMRVYRNGVQVMSGGAPYAVGLPYLWSDLPGLVVEQSNDVLTVTHANHAPREIARYGHDDWRVTVLTFAPPALAPELEEVTPTIGYTAANDGTKTPNEVYVPTPYRYRVTAVLADGTETAPSAAVQAVNDLRWYPSNWNVVDWANVAGAEFYNVYKEDSGLYGLIGTATQTQFTDNNFKPNLTDAPPSNRNPFTGAGKYPRASAFFQQRRMFGGTIERPQTTWGTISGNYYNFSIARPAKASDAIEFTIAGRKKQTIRHYIALQDLIVFTESGEWRVAGTENGVLTPTGSIKATQQSEWGIGDVPPLVVGDQVLFVLRDGRQVRDLGYKFESDTYSGSDLTILSHHLFDGRQIREWAHQQSPHGILWCVMDDGTLNALTYLREHEVWAWTKHTTDGYFESVAVVSENNVDVPYFVVLRLINGQYHRYIERMRPDRSTLRQDAFFVDSGLTYYGAAVSSVAGLGHLEGKKVVGIADGAVVGVDEDLIVTGGAVTLPFAAEKIHLGLGYESLFESLSFALNDRVAEGVIKGVGEVTLRVKDTSGIEVGPSFDQLNESKDRLFEDYGEAPTLKTGTISLSTASDYDEEGTVCIRQRYPLPTTILALVPQIDYAG